MRGDGRVECWPGQVTGDIGVGAADAHAALRARGVDAASVSHSHGADHTEPAHRARVPPPAPASRAGHNASSIVLG